MGSQEAGPIQRLGGMCLTNGLLLQKKPGRKRIHDGEGERADRCTPSKDWNNWFYGIRTQNCHHSRQDSQPLYHSSARHCLWCGRTSYQLIPSRKWTEVIHLQPYQQKLRGDAPSLAQACSRHCINMDNWIGWNPGNLYLFTFTMKWAWADSLTEHKEPA